MKVGIILVLVIMGILAPSLSYGASDLELGTRLIPSKLVEDREGTIQVFGKQGTEVLPEKINGLTVTSLDSSILRVLTVKDSESGFTSEVIVKGVKAGDTKLYLAATGFEPKELPVTVYGNVLSQEQLLVKVVPDSFSSDGPFRGFVSVELADKEGTPVKASEDVRISLSVPNNNILEIFQKDLVIKKGEYFVGTHFTVKESGATGKTNIFASAQNMEAKSNEITVDEEDELDVKLYLLQDEINVFGKGAKGHVIVQLQKADSGEEPVIARKNIEVKYKVTNDVFENQNTSPNAVLGESSGTITIKKDSYWGHATFSLLGPVSGLFDAGGVGGSSSLNPAIERDAGTYTVTITSGDPLALETETVDGVFYSQPAFGLTANINTNQFQTPPNDGDRFVKFEALPIFATGNTELIGLVHLEDKDEFPILADKNLEINIDSSDTDFLSIDTVLLQAGENSALVFGKVGHSIPEETFELNPVVEVEDDSATTIEADVFGPKEESLKLIAEPLVSKVLAGTEFPIIVYVEDENNEVTKFPKNSNLFASPNEIFEIETKQVFSGDDLVMLNTKATEKGSAKLQFTVNDLKDAEITIESITLKPAKIIVDHSDAIFTGNNDVFSVQTLNSQDLPVYATEDTEINFVVKDESLLQVPKSTIIKKGDYFSIFDAAPKASGTTEITALSEGIPSSTTEIEIKSLAPELKMDIPELIENGETFVATLTVINNGLPLSGLEVKWNVDGGILQLSDSKTGATGEALASIISTSNQQVDIQASTSGSWYAPSKISKIVRVNATSDFVAFADDGQASQEFTKFEVGGFDPVIIIVPAAIVAVGYMLKKQGSFEAKKPTEVKST